MLTHDDVGCGHFKIDLVGHSAMTPQGKGSINETCRLWLRDKGQRFVLTTLDSQQSIDPELRPMAGQLNIKLLVAPVHNLRVLLLFFDFILFIS